LGHPPPGLENFPQKSQISTYIFPKKYQGHSRVGPLFTAGQKYAGVRSGPISDCQPGQIDWGLNPKPQVPFDDHLTTPKRIDLKI